MVSTAPNFTKLKGIENLTDIDIALSKSLHCVAADDSVKRVCIDLVSDVLLQHHAVITRKWLSSLLVNLKAKRFTTLAVVDPTMHQSEEAQALISMFDSEISIAENNGVRSLKIRKLHNKKYLTDEFTFSKTTVG
jgi:hypothetical protein